MILKDSKIGFEKENHDFFWGGVKLFLNIYISMINENSIVKFHI